MRVVLAGRIFRLTCFGSVAEIGGRILVEMGHGRPQVVRVAPGGLACDRVVRGLLRPGVWLTALEDGALVPFRREAQEGEVEVLPWGSFLSRLANMCGDSGHPRVTGPQMRELVRAAAGFLPGGHLMAPVAGSDGLAEAVGRTLTELHHHYYTAGDLRSAASEASDLVGRKLLGLADLEDAVRGICREKGLEFGADRAEACLSSEPPDARPFERVVVIATGPSRPLYDDLVKWVAEIGPVTVVVEDLAGAGFEVSKSRIGRLDPTVVQDVRGTAWQGVLFTEGTADDHPSLRTVRAGDLLSECEWAVRDIQALMRSGDVRAEEVGIYVRDPETYLPLLKSAALRHGLMMEGSFSTPLLSNGFAGFVRGVLGALSGEDVRGLEPWLRSSYFEWAGSGASEAVDLVRQGHREGVSAAGLGGQWRALGRLLGEVEGFTSLRGLVDWRSAVADRRVGIHEWSELFRLMWVETEVLGQVAAEGLTRERDSRALSALQRSILNSALRLPSGLEMGFGEFAQFAFGSWEREQVAWSGLERGVKASESLNHLVGLRYLFVLGMLEGQIPRRRREDTVLDDEEREWLAECFPEKPALPTSELVARGERDEFVRICGSASEGLTFSYPLSWDEKDNVPAFYLEELRRSAGRGVVEVNRSRREFAPALEECASWSDLELRRALDGPREDFPDVCLVDERARAVVRPTEETGIGLRELAEASTCAFRSVARHRLPMRPRSERRGIWLFSRVPSMAGLAGASNEASARAALSAAVEVVIDERAAEMGAWEPELLRDLGERLVEDWVWREFTAREFLGLEGGNVRTGLSVEEAPMRGPASIRLNFTVPAVVETARKRVFVLYETRAPYSKTEWDDDPELRFLVSALFVFGEWQDREVQVMIDVMEGVRTLYRLRGGEDRFKRPSWLHVFPLPAAASPDMRSAVMDLREKMDLEIKMLNAKLRLAASRPEPGDQCDRCRYGDLCRRHRDTGDPVSLFDLDEPGGGG